MKRAGAPASHEFSIARREKRIKPRSEALEEGWFFLRHALEILQFSSRFTKIQVVFFVFFDDKQRKKTFDCNTSTPPSSYPLPKLP
jgi:hypothetical protein